MLLSSFLYLKLNMPFKFICLSDVQNENCCSMRVDKSVNPGFKPKLCSSLAMLFLASHVRPLSFSFLIRKRKKSNFSISQCVREDQMK